MESIDSMEQLHLSDDDDDQILPPSLESLDLIGWQPLQEFTSVNEMNCFLNTYSHKMTASHGNQKSNCKIHIDSHPQLYGYYKCSSKKCVQDPTDICNFRIRVNKLLCSYNVTNSLTNDD